MPAIINIFQNLPLTIITLSIILLLTFPFKKEKLYCLFLLFAIASTFALVKTDNYFHVLLIWVWNNIFLLFAALVNSDNKSKPHHLSLFLTCFTADCIFFFLSFTMVDYVQIFALLPLLVRCNIVPFNFFSSDSDSKSFKHELHLTTINFMMAFIFITKFNIDKSLLSTALLISMFLTSLRFIKHCSSTGILMTLYTVSLNMTLLFLINDYEAYSFSSFIFFAFIFTMLTAVIPNNISPAVLSHDNRCTVNFRKISAIIILSSLSLIPLFFSSSIILSTFELAIFNYWKVTRYNSFEPLSFMLFAWFCMNYHGSLTFLARLILYDNSSKERYHKLNTAVVLIVLPASLFLSSNFIFTGEISFINNSQQIPLSAITGGIGNYLKFFYAPLLILSITGLYLLSTWSRLRIIPGFYALLFNISSFNLLYQRVSFYDIQSFFGKLSQSCHENLKSFPAFFVHAFRLSVKLIGILKATIQSINKSKQKILAYKINPEIITENFSLIMIIFVFWTISFLSDMEYSFVAIIILTISSILIGYLLTITEEEHK